MLELGKKQSQKDKTDAATKMLPLPQLLFKCRYTSCNEKNLYG